MRYKVLGMGNGELGIGNWELGIGNWESFDRLRNRGIGKKLQMYLTLYENRYSESK
jgi:hypothetical protein